MVEAAHGHALDGVPVEQPQNQAPETAQTPVDI